MPIDNLGKFHFTDAEKQQLTEAIDTILAIISPKAYVLTPKERIRYGKVGEQKKLLLNAVKEMHDRQPDLASPDVDWAEFEADYATRRFAEMQSLKLKSAAQMLFNIKVLHDHDNLADALRDYNFAVYKSRFADERGHASKAAKLKTFFPKTGKKKKKE